MGLPGYSFTQKRQRRGGKEHGYKYKLADGQVVDVEVSPEVAADLEEFDRIEASWNHKVRRRKVTSYETINEETGWEPTDTTVNIESDYITREECRCDFDRAPNRKRREYTPNIPSNRNICKHSKTYRITRALPHCFRCALPPCGAVLRSRR